MRFLAYFVLLIFLSPISTAAFDDLDPTLSAKIVSPVTGTNGDVRQVLGLFIPVPKGWKLYGAQAKGAAGYPPSIHLVKRENLKNLKFLWPLEESFDFQGQSVSGYRKDTLIPIDVELESPEQALTLEGTISYLICEGICVPKTSHFHLTLPNTPKLPSKDAFLFHLPQAISSPQETLGVILIFAFLGGLILNFMPCVLPVLSLKLMSLVRKAEDGKMVRISSFFTFMGILFSFLILGSLSSIFKLSGDVFQWGGQFQNPYFLLFMTAIMFFFAANLWGKFEVGQGLVHRIPIMNHRTILADVWNGFVAVFLATPCSAPFLGTALSFTLSQTPAMVFLIFSCMALGFGLPYLLLMMVPPSWIRLPKPGRWMKTFKTLLGWGMYLTALWMLWIFLEHLSIAPYLLLIIALGFLLSQKKRTFWFTLSLFVVTAILLLHMSSPKSFTAFEGEEKIQQHLMNGKTVVAKLTAKWCLTCQLIDHAIFQDQDILKIMQDPEVETLIGDWTKPDPKIDTYLKLKNRLGIPLIVIYGPQNKQGIILSEFPSKQEVLQAFQHAGLDTSQK